MQTRRHFVNLGVALRFTYSVAVHGLYTLGAADVASLKGLLEQHRSRAEQTLGRVFGVPVC